MTYSDVEPYLHQAKALHAIGRNKAFALTMEMGTGKTFVAIKHIARIREELNYVVVLAPSGVHRNWENEIDRYLPPDIEREVLVWTNSKKDKEIVGSWGKASESLRILCVNYEALGHPGPLKVLTTLVKKASKHGLMIVVDEFDGFKNPTANRSKVLLSWTTYASHRLILSGTPINSSPADLWVPYTFLSPSATGNLNYRQFCAKFIEMLPPYHPIVLKIRRAGRVNNPQIPATNPNGTVIPKNTRRLGSLISPYTYRVTKDECLDLPEKIYHSVFFELTPAQRKAYNSMKRDLIAEIGDKQFIAANKLTSLIRMAQLSSGFLTDARGDVVELFEKNPKRDKFMELVEKFIHQDKSMVVWCRFQHEVQSLHAALKGKLPIYLYYGGVDESTRAKNLEDFQNSPGPSLFLGTTATAGVGINLTVSDTVIYYSNTYSLRDRVQSEDRCHRIGQTRKVLYLDMVGIDTLDQAIVRALRSKQEVANTVLQEVKHGRI